MESNHRPRGHEPRQLFQCSIPLYFCLAFLQKAPSENRTRIFCMANRWVPTTPWAPIVSIWFLQVGWLKTQSAKPVVAVGIEPPQPAYKTCALSKFNSGVGDLSRQLEFELERTTNPNFQARQSTSPIYQIPTTSRCARSRAGGIRTLIVRIKSPTCCR